MRVPTLSKLKSDLAFPRIWDRIHQSRPRFHLELPFRKPRRELVNIQAPSPEIVGILRTYSKWASIVAMVIGYHVLLGWVFDISVLKAPSAAFTPMKINSAVCSVVAGVALYFLQTQRQSLASSRSLVVSIASGVVALLSGLSLVEIAFDADFGIDSMILPYISAAVDGPQIRMTVTSALSFIALAIALAAVDGTKFFRVVEVCGLAAVAMSLFAISAYLYQAEPFPGQMPLYTSFVVFLLGTGVLAARADRGFMAKVTSNSFGGIMARRLLPGTLIFPVILGWLQHLGERRGLYTSAPGLAIFAVANILVFVSVVWWGVSSLHRMDTKRRQAEDELKETVAKLARSNADLEQFAYVASHDLKEPLRAISGSVQILQERYKGEIDPNADEIIKHTVDGATRMQTLIEDLLTYSRLTTREAPLAPTNCEDLFEEVLANLEAAIRESRAVVTHDPLPTISADRIQLLQVFQNLISNAIKYRSERTPKIHVSAEDHDHEWLFSVRDNGIGIAPQYADRIFRIFQRLHTRKEYGGTGIGLAVCKKVVERHGGRIWVESEPEEGSTFFFTLPK